MPFCPQCSSELQYVQQHNQYYCPTCQQYQQLTDAGAGAPPAQSRGPAPQTSIWFQNMYRIRKKVLTIGTKYWIEDPSGQMLGYTKKKKFKLKEDIRIFSDESMTVELFRIKQQQIIDMWGTFDIIDSWTNTKLGAVQRRGLKSTYWVDEWKILDPQGQQIGKLKEGTVRGLLRKLLGGIGDMIPEKLTLELMGKKITEIKQKFKIVGDVWELDCTNVPSDFDRRVLLGMLLLMAIIERGKN